MQSFSALHGGESLILTDPKSELYEDMAVYLENQGYTVQVFNLVSPENSDSWNCLCEIEGQETMAQIFCDVIIQNTGAGKGRKRNYHKGLQIRLRGLRY